MTLQLNTADDIIIDGQNTGLKLKQASFGTVIYTPGAEGQSDKVHAMPHWRYSTSHDNPLSLGGRPEHMRKLLNAGRSQLEVDIKALLNKITDNGGHCTDR